MISLQQPVGYYKDVIATGAFSIAFVLFATIGIPKQIIMIGLIACIMIDGVFTLNPSWHCMSVGKNAATYTLVAQAILTLGILINTLKH